MIIDEITVHNFGVYLGRQTISLDPGGSQKPVILIGGMNGGGKTTLMDAFQLCMFGKLATCSNRGSLAYDHYLRKCIHKAVDPRDGAAISITFRHSVNGKENSYQLNRSWRMNKKNMAETLEVICDGAYDSVITEAWHEHAEQFIPLRISSLFFFDGEKIKDLADFDKSTELVSTAINQLLGLDLIERLITDLVVLEKRKKIGLSDQFKRQNIHLIEQRIRELRKQKDDLYWQMKDSEKTQKLLVVQLAEIDEKFRLEGGELYQNREKLESQKESTDQELRELRDRLIDHAANELPLFLISDDLRQILAQSEIEEKADNSERLYDTLRKRDLQVIADLRSKQLPNEALIEIQKLLEKDLGERAAFKQVERYLRIDADTKDAIKAILDDFSQNKISEVRGLIEQKTDAETKVENLDRKLANVPDAEAIAGLIERKEKLKAAKQDFDIGHAVLQKEFQNIEKAILNAEKELEKELEKEFDTEYEQDSAARIIKYSAKSRKTLEVFKAKVTGHHLSRIQNFVLEAFRQLLRKETLVSGLTFDPNTYALKITGADNRTVDVHRLSAGERQLLAVSLLWGLAQASGRPLPTMIDTPLGRLDTTHRSHLVARYFPYASHQVVLLSTDEEINEKYYLMIKPWVSKKYHLEFDESKQSTTIEEGYFW